MPDFREAIGVDVGTKRIGLARINAVAKIAQPLETIEMDDTAPEKIKAYVASEKADVVVVGVPLTSSGIDSEQTLISRSFADTLKEHGLQVVLFDETLSTQEAQKRLDSGQYRKNAANNNVGIDEAAACVILENYINEGRM